MLLCLGEMMNHFLGGKLIATFSTVSLGAGLFASSASIGGKELRAIGNVSGVVTGLISELLALLGLSAKHLLLEPSHPGLKGLKLLGQLCDLSLLIRNEGTQEDHERQCFKCFADKEYRINRGDG